jgi:hypothetical protein
MPVSSTVDPAMQQMIQAQMAARGQQNGAAPADPNADLKALMPKPTPQMAQLTASGRYDPAQLSQVMGSSAPTAQQPPAGGQAPAIATVPGGLPAPLSPPLPQMYKPGDEPANVQMQQMPGGMSVDQGQAGAAKHALGLDRLPDFNTYLQQTRMHNTVLPGAGDQNQILQQYLGLQKAQEANDLQGTNRMQAADTGAHQRGQVGVEQQKNSLAAWNADPINFALAKTLEGVGSGAIPGYEVGPTMQKARTAISASGVGVPPGSPQGAPPPGYPQPQTPAPGGGSALPMQPGANIPPPAGPPVQDVTAAMMAKANGQPGNGPTTAAPGVPAAHDPLLKGTPEQLTDALHEAAEKDLPQSKGQPLQSRSQADTVLQFESNHPGLLQQSPEAFNAMASFLGSRPDAPGQPGSGGQTGLQKLWHTTQPIFTQPSSTDQRAQQILQRAAEIHTGKRTVNRGTSLGVPFPSTGGGQSIGPNYHGPNY